MSDIEFFGSEDARTMLADDYARAIAGKRFAAILLDGGNQNLLAELEKHYVRQELDLGGANVLWPLTGARTRPRLMFVRRPISDIPAARTSPLPR